MFFWKKRELSDLQLLNLASSVDEARGIIEKLGGYPIFLSPQFSWGFTLPTFVECEDDLPDIFERVCQRSTTRGCFISRPRIYLRYRGYVWVAEGVDSDTISELTNVIYSLSLQIPPPFFLRASFPANLTKELFYVRVPSSPSTKETIRLMVSECVERLKRDLHHVTDFELLTSRQFCTG